MDSFTFFHASWPCSLSKSIVQLSYSANVWASFMRRRSACSCVSGGLLLYLAISSARCCSLLLGDNSLTTSAYRPTHDQKIGEREETTDRRIAMLTMRSWPFDHRGA